MVQILHIDLKLSGSEEAKVRFFWDHPNEFQELWLPLDEIGKLNQWAQESYYTYLPLPYPETGHILYDWLNQNYRLENTLRDCPHGEQIVLAIAAEQGLANLPWEILHDGERFLVEYNPAIVPVGWVKRRTPSLSLHNQPNNRVLNVLFMATSPSGVKTVLDFEAEEGQILKATERKKSLCLTVEESGNLQELGYLVEDYAKGYFDVAHFTGHAEIEDGQPYFLTETELGERENSTAQEIARALQFNTPKLMFLSGCRTGYSDAVPSMAEALLNQGATAVLSWGDRVKDDLASEAAGKLYEALSVGKTVTEALALTYQALLQSRESGRWHLLRLYIADLLPGALVTPLRTKGREPIPRPDVVEQFIDNQRKLRLLPRHAFVGRRRQLQSCLRILKTDWSKMGVLLTGMGGWGKSTIAARLCDRLSEYTPLVWWRQIDEGDLSDRLGEQLSDKRRKKLRDADKDLKSRLRSVLKALHKNGERLLFVFDDFEWNLEQKRGRYHLKPNVALCLEALVAAIQNTEHRITITCRYQFEWQELNRFFIQPLDSFHHADLQKKLRRLEHFSSGELNERLILD
ncbi:MAG: CHAT domain-containing protein [Roseofilum sp. SBFL]|uniref:CHAT domain-containing protein n=1 Tax=unclassified Roseofilum TaxID=2620099 RepID=UPI001B07B8A6|nr:MULTISPECIES: CHAT domain-containing protein [unclassified Roseofilum]MBP0014275.1 CHAT domain-containing protein [Roseofilum sp. SID3]MBP0025368.1 CHAT domain-containing protein [Roseofilum sp. SID2]MBP0036149.1 CHAT domain-containing protein [Roseofilum sp. SID1]MBP0041155.1 CHAT domain-containing protein [Roseofilum sp. SBFL]